MKTILALKVRWLARIDRPQSKLGLMPLLIVIMATAHVDLFLVQAVGHQLCPSLEIGSFEIYLLLGTHASGGVLLGLSLPRILIRELCLKRLLMWCVVTEAVGMIGCALSPSIGFLYCSRFVAGCGAFGAKAGILCLLGGTTAPEAMGRNAGLVLSAIPVAVTFMLPAAIAIASSTSPQFPFVVLAVLLVCVLPGLSRFPFPQTTDGRGADSGCDQSLGPWAWTLGLLIWAPAGLAMPGLSIWLDAAGVGPSAIASTYLLGGLISLVGMPCTGRLSDRLGHSAVLAGTALISCVLLALLGHALAPAPGYAQLLGTLLLGWLPLRLAPTHAMLIRGNLSLMIRLTMASNVAMTMCPIVVALCWLAPQEDPVEGFSLYAPALAAIVILMACVALGAHISRNHEPAVTSTGVLRVGVGASSCHR